MDVSDESGRGAERLRGIVAARAVLTLAVLLWGWFALDGLGDDAVHRPYYLYLPLGMAALSGSALAATWSRRFIGGLGCAGVILILLLFVYLIPFTGGM
jgi:peptidoglycan/LPS O-acetylase OafA/YrhL